MSIRIIIADNHEVVRQGISLFIEQQQDMEIIARERFASNFIPYKFVLKAILSEELGLTRA